MLIGPKGMNLTPFKLFLDDFWTTFSNYHSTCIHDSMNSFDQVTSLFMVCVTVRAEKQ